MPLRIIYMGSTDFSVGPLTALMDHGYDIQAIVTVPDKPAGRGQKLRYSPVKEFAMIKRIPLLQPGHPKEDSFVGQLKELKPDLQVVVAFRILPEVVWAIPPLGTFNLHASLLPQYRGAAPINWAIINGEEVTGVTTFFLNQNVDTGKILFQSKMFILPDETAGELHQRLMTAGASLVVQSVKAIENHNVRTIDQQHLVPDAGELKIAPKIRREDCHLNWSDSCIDIHNRIRGLSPDPGSFFLFRKNNDTFPIKVFRSHAMATPSDHTAGYVVTDHKTCFGITTMDGIVYLEEVQLPSRKRMPIREFLKGFPVDENLMVL